jgi:hypothetical protein
MELKYLDRKFEDCRIDKKTGEADDSKASRPSRARDADRSPSRFSAPRSDRGERLRLARDLDAFATVALRDPDLCGLNTEHLAVNQPSDYEVVLSAYQQRNHLSPVQVCFFDRSLQFAEGPFRCGKTAQRSAPLAFNCNISVATAVRAPSTDFCRCHRTLSRKSLIVGFSNIG